LLPPTTACIRAIVIKSALAVTVVFTRRLPSPTAARTRSPSRSRVPRLEAFKLTGGPRRARSCANPRCYDCPRVATLAFGFLELSRLPLDLLRCPHLHPFFTPATQDRPKTATVTTFVVSPASLGFVFGQGRPSLALGLLAHLLHQSSSNSVQTQNPVPVLLHQSRTGPGLDPA
jgi:hypothetical protein